MLGRCWRMGMMLLAIWSPALVHVCPALARDSDAPIPTRQTAFSIPFKIEGGQDVMQVPIEVQLHVSDDLGVTWRLHDQVSPEAGRFTFRAPKDGEYWFMVRTRDRQGKLRPEGPATPELRVLVDSTPPVLSLKAERNADGAVVLHWQASDQNLQADSLKIAYQAPGEGDIWHDVAIEPSQRATPSDSAEFTGDVTYRPPQAGALLTFRAEVRDRTDNRVLATARVETSGDRFVQGAAPTQHVPGPAATPPPPGSALPPPGTGLSAAPPPAMTPGTLGSQLENRIPSMAKTWPGEVSSQGLLATEPRSQGITGVVSSKPLEDPIANNVLPPPASALPGMSPPGIGTRGMGEMVATPPATSPGSGSLAADRGMTSPNMTSTSFPLPAPSMDALPPQPGASMMTASSTTTAPTVAAGELPPPPGVTPRMLNSRRFELEYDIDSTGGAGVNHVELWGTRDGGRNWISYGEDNDNHSPFIANLDRDGLYGFRMVVVTQGGASTPPRSGEQPDIWVEIDTEAPTAQLTVETFGEDTKPGDLTIRWRAHDEHLPDRPISLLFAETPSGPWSTIVSGLENSGRYVWHPGNRMPPQLFVRLTVRDEAGNELTVDTPEPITLPRVRPQGHILNVRPVK